MDIKSHNRLLFFIIFLNLFFMFLSCNEMENPKIVDSYPNPNTPFTEKKPEIYVEFSKEMDLESVEENFLLTSEYPGTKGIFRWQGNRIYYDLIKELEHGGRYSLKVSANAKSKDGNRLSRDYLVNFYIGEDRTPPSVIEISPLNLDFNVSPEVIVTITFDQSMRPKETENAFSLSPSMKGLFSWDETFMVMTFSPLENFSFSQTYTVSVSESAQNTNGIPLLTEFKSYFRVGENFIKPNITSINTLSNIALTDGQTNVEKDDIIVVRFDKAMDISSAESAFSLTKAQNDSEISGSFLWPSSDFNEFQFIPEDFLTPQTKYRIKISTSARDTIGNNLIKEENIFFAVLGANSRFIQIQAITIETAGVYVDNDGDTIPDAGFDISNSQISNIIKNLGATTFDIKITFSVSIQTETLPENISINQILGIDMANPGKIDAFVWSNNNRELTVELGSISTDNEYKITITGGIDAIKDINDNYLKDDLIILFNANP